MKQEEKIKIKRLYLQGDSMRQITGKTGYSRQTVHLVAKEYGLMPRRSVIKKICPVCNKEYTTQFKNQKVYCSQACYIKHMKQNNISYGNKKYKGKSVRNWQRQARNIAIEAIDDLWQKLFVVHHNDGDISNNSRSNLFVFFSQSGHLAYHHRSRIDSRTKPKGSEGIQL